MNNAFLVEENNPLYKKALSRELEVWSNQPQCLGGSRCTCGNCTDNDSNFSLLSEDNPLFREERNRVIGKRGISDWAWVNYLVEKFGTFDLGLSLGSGRGSTEKFALGIFRVTARYKFNLKRRRMTEISFLKQ